MISPVANTKTPVEMCIKVWNVRMRCAKFLHISQKHENSLMQFVRQKPCKLTDAVRKTKTWKLTDAVRKTKT